MDSADSYAGTTREIQSTIETMPTRLPSQAAQEPCFNPARRVVAGRRRARRVVAGPSLNLQLATFNLELPAWPAIATMTSLRQSHRSHWSHRSHRSHHSRKNTKGTRREQQKTLKERQKDTQNTRKNTKEHQKTLKEQPLTGGPTTRLPGWLCTKSPGARLYKPQRVQKHGNLRSEQTFVVKSQHSLRKPTPAPGPKIAPLSPRQSEARPGMPRRSGAKGP